MSITPTPSFRAPEPATVPRFAPGNAGVLRASGLTLGSYHVAPDRPDQIAWRFAGGLPSSAFTLDIAAVDSLPGFRATHRLAGASFRAVPCAHHTEAGNHLFVTNTGTEVLFLHFVDRGHHRWGTTRLRTLPPGTYHFTRVHSVSGHFHTGVDQVV